MEDGLTVPFSRLVRSSRFGIEMVNCSRAAGFCPAGDLTDGWEMLLSLLRFEVLGKRWIFC